MRNVSADKLLNSSFHEIEEEEAYLTRNKSEKSGLIDDQDESKAHGFRLQDATLLWECISAASVCSNCRKLDGKQFDTE